MITRRQRKRSWKRKRFIVGATVMFFLLVSWGACRVFLNDSIPVSTQGSYGGGIIERLVPRGHDILSAAIPGFDKQGGPASIVSSSQSKISFQWGLRGIVGFFTGVDLRDARSLLRAEIPLISLFTSNTPTVSAMSLPNFPKFEWRKGSLPGKPLIGIYHTHTAESFIPSAGAAHKPGGQAGDIVDVGEGFAKRLNKDGIPVIQSKAIHDYPSFMKAYGPSEMTARKMLEENPSIQMIFDIHRDADKRENTTAVINGEAVAKITIVVGMGQPDLLQPHWQQNHAFAKLIDAKLNQYYPGLSKGIQLVEWRYNQHLHPRALLLEVGCQENSKEEAIRSMELLADIVAEILAES